MQIVYNVNSLNTGTGIMYCEGIMMAEDVVRPAENVSAENVSAEAAPPLKTELEQARESKRKADEDYKALLAKITGMLRDITENSHVTLAALDGMVTDIIGAHARNDKSVLLENMQVVRLDLDAERSYFVYHSLNVALLNALLGQTLRVEGDDYRRLVKLGLVSDFGMMRLPPELRRRDTRYDPKQLAQIQRHPKLSVDLLEKSGETDDDLFAAVAAHHERFNGQGYPRRLRGHQSPYLARISAVNDSFDAAMAQKRYGDRKSPFDILSELMDNQSLTLDPAITRVAVWEYAHKLVGRYVLLSDNSMAQVLTVDYNNLRYPEVRILNRRVQTSPQLHPVALTGYLPLF